jgi:hypothetical protein
MLLIHYVFSPVTTIQVKPCRMCETRALHQQEGSSSLGGSFINRIASLHYTAFETTLYKKPWGIRLVSFRVPLPNVHSSD